MIAHRRTHDTDERDRLRVALESNSYGSCGGVFAAITGMALYYDTLLVAHLLAASLLLSDFHEVYFQSSYRRGI